MQNFAFLCDFKAFLYNFFQKFAKMVKFGPETFSINLTTFPNRSTYPITKTVSDAFADRK